MDRSMDGWQAVDVAALAAGRVEAKEVAFWRARAERKAYAFDGGHVVAHQWRASGSMQPIPLVLLHGGSGSWTHWVRSIGPLLEQGWSVCAVDLPGFGASDAPAGAGDADGIVPLLHAALCHWFDNAPVAVLGFSFGAMTAAMLAADFPASVTKLCLVGVPGLGLRADPPVQLKGWRHLSAPEEQLQRHRHNLHALMVTARTAIDTEMLALHIANVQRDRMPRRRLSGTEVVLRSLERVRCPVMAIFGAQDALYPGVLPVAEAKMAAATVQWRGMQQVAQAGHWVQYERPLEFHRALQAWLRLA